MRILRQVFFRKLIFFAGINNKLTNFMQDKKTYTIVVAVFLIIIGFVIWGWKSGYLSTNDDSGKSTDIIYYYGKECPHCADVSKFLKENKIAEKIDFSKREIFHNSVNNQAMQEKAKECNITSEGMGVPFVWARGECFIGTPNVESFFTKEAGI